MTEPFVIAIPVMIFVIVALLAFTGCGEIAGVDPWPEPTPGPSHMRCETSPAIDVGSTQATLMGKLDLQIALQPDDLDCHFEYGKNPFPADPGGASPPGTISTPGAFLSGGGVEYVAKVEITDLDFDSDYYFRILAKVTTAQGWCIDTDQQFHTLPSPSPPSPAYHEVILSNSDLLSYWRLDDTTAVATDSAGNNDGDYVGGYSLLQPGALTGAGNFAVEFDPGAQGQMTVDTGPVLLDACSIEGWFYWTGGRGLLTDDVGDDSGWRFAFEKDGNLTYRFAGTDFDTGTPVVDVQNAWHHFVATKDNVGKVAFYLDGLQIHADSGAGATPAETPWHLMRDQPSGDYTAGRADEVAMYSVALPPSTVQEHFQKGKFG